jgi:diguanylate cyclase (GGDEF)-like protein
MLTSHNAHDQQLNGMQAGADDYLAKPFVKEELTLRLIAAERITTLHATLRSQQQELQRLNEQLYRDGRRCALTRVANRLQLDEDLAQRHATTHRYGQAFCLAMFDIDFFKAYNDTCGHVAGDQILKQVAATLAGAGRLSDRVYRYGGEEFTAVYGFGNLQGATAAAERMRGAVAALSLAHPGHPQGGVLTVSGGVVCYSGEPKTTVQELIARADAALYQAKERGRNQIVTG